MEVQGTGVPDLIALDEGPPEVLEFKLLRVASVTSHLSLRLETGPPSLTKVSFHFEFHLL